MGLDLIVLGKAKPGCDAEWERLMEIAYEGGTHSDAEVARLEQISIEPAGDGDGLPKYTPSGMYDGVSSTSFRGSFLQFCEGPLGRDLLERAFTTMMRPRDAVAYGNQLLAIA